MIKKIIPLTVLALSVSSCFTLYTNNKIERPCEERLKVEFENEQAARLFSGKHRELESRCRVYQEKRDLDLIVVSLYKERRITSKNAFYNDQVDKCDSNGDRHISEIEARVFADPGSLRSKVNFASNDARRRFTRHYENRRFFLQEKQLEVVFYNKEIEHCDSNGDSLLSDDEVEAYEKKPSTR